MRSLLIVSSVLVMTLSPAAQAQNKFVGAKACLECHKDTDAQGKASHPWQASQHAGAYATLQTHTESAPRQCQDLELWIVEIGRGVRYGLPKPAVESKECLPCHVTAFGADAQSLAPTFDMKDGVQCESCHGPGAAHVEAARRKDTANVAATLKHFDDERAIRASCRGCHEGTCGDFDFAEMWPKIKHPGSSAR